MKKQPIRILHILQRMEAGGTQALLMNIYRNIDREKVQFDFLVEYPNKQFYDDEIISLGGKIFYTNIRNDYNIFKFKKQLKRILNENDYKIVHVHAFTIGYICLKTAKECNIPVRIAHSHNNETVHDSKYFLKKIMQKLYTIYATDLFACSNEAGKYLFKNKKFTVLNNAIDTKKFEYNESIRRKMRSNLKIENNFVVGHVGRLHTQKNHDFLIDIFKEIKHKRENSKLLLIGTGPLENKIKEKIKNCKLENDVLFLGNRTDVNDIYQAMDVFVFPSLFEGLGIVTIEAQVSGTPVICSDKLPKEIEITNLCTKVSLDKDAVTWADICLKKSENEKKADLQYKEEVVKAGYDILVTSKKLENYYLEKYKVI